MVRVGQSVVAILLALVLGGPFAQASLPAPAPAPPELTPPWVVSTSPASGSTVSSSAIIEVRFSVMMNRTAVEASFGYGDGYFFYTAKEGSVTWASAAQVDDTFRFDPRLEFASGGVIAARLDGSVAVDEEGNRLDGNRDGIGGDDYTWMFSIAADPTPPRVVQAEPVSGASNVSISTTIRIIFSKAMTPVVAEGSFTLVASGAPTLTKANGTTWWSGTRFPDDTMVFDPYPNLGTLREYRFTIFANTLVDREGHRLDGNGNGVAQGSPIDDFQTRFTTEDADRTAPTVWYRYPARNATDVLPTTPIAIGFTERMNRTSVESGFSLIDGGSVLGIGDGNATWTLGVDGFVFRPARTLDFGASYTVALSGAIARDEAGNQLNGGGEERWQFATASQNDTLPPRILWTSPFDGQENVSRTQRFTVIFSEPMNRDSVQSAIGLTENVAIVDIRWPNEETIEFATSQPMAYKTAHVLFVRTTAKDLSGNSIVQSEQIRFTTEPWRGTVFGRVEDQTGSGIADARVQLGTRAVLTNETGDFSFAAVEQGTYTLVVSGEGFESYTRDVVIEPELGGVGTIILRPLTPGSTVALLAAAVGVVLAAIAILLVLRRRRGRPREGYETWKPAKVVVMEPGETEEKVDDEWLSE